MKLYTDQTKGFTADLFYKVYDYYFISRLDSAVVVKIHEAYIVVATKEL